jgi:hypothetical protein
MNLLLVLLVLLFALVAAWNILDIIMTRRSRRIVDAMTDCIKASYASYESAIAEMMARAADEAEMETEERSCE